MKRNEFIASIAALPLALPSCVSAAPTESNVPAGVTTGDDFWETFRKKFHTDDAYIDLRCKRVSSASLAALDHFTTNIRHIEALPSDRYSGIAEGERERLRGQIATKLNAQTGEVAMMRNTTEALNNAIMGFPFAEGDEVIVGTHEYDSMIASLRHQEILKGIKIVEIDIPYKPESTEQIVDAYRQAITPNTKMFLISHIIWISGQIYPIKEICSLASERNIFTIIDAAQSFSHIPIDVRDIGCDYLGASLHKWTAAPLGTGFLYIKKEHISKTMPLMAHYVYLPDDPNIEKFEGTGTITPVFQSAALSMDVWQDLGATVKTERMQYLKHYWVDQLQDNKRVTIETNIGDTHSCGFTFFSIKGRSSKEVTALLKGKYNIITSAIEDYKNAYVDYRGVNAISVATSVLTLERELDRFCEVINELTV